MVCAALLTATGVQAAVCTKNCTKNCAPGLLEGYAAGLDTLTYDIVVAQDGSGHFTTIQAAIESIRAFKPGPRTRVFIKNGTYYEKVIVHSWVSNVTFIGESVDQTVITYDHHANIDHMGTFRTHTLLVQGNDICFENLTVENNAPQLGQAVALHVEGDRVAFFNCRFLGNQDTIYTGREQTRNFFFHCYIEGTTDFIFGPSTAWFEACLIHCKRDSYITAASTPVYVRYGYVLNACRVTVAEGVTKMYLGRPWRQWGQTLFMKCELPQEIRPEGWHNWNKKENEETARYSEYKNFGPGAATEGRVAWSRQLNDDEARDFTITKVMGDWNPFDRR